MQTPQLPSASRIECCLRVKGAFLRYYRRISILCWSGPKLQVVPRFSFSVMTRGKFELSVTGRVWKVA